MAADVTGTERRRRRRLRLRAPPALPRPPRPRFLAHLRAARRRPRGRDRPCVVIYAGRSISPAPDVVGVEAERRRPRRGEADRRHTSAVVPAAERRPARRRDREGAVSPACKHRDASDPLRRDARNQGRAPTRSSPSPRPTASCTRSAGSGRRARSRPGRRPSRAGRSCAARSSSSRSTRSSTSAASTTSIAFMPPRTGTTTKYVVYLQKSDVKPS